MLETHKKPAPSVSAKDDSDSEKTAHKVTPKEPPKKPVSSHPPKEEPNVDHTPEMAHPAPAKKPVAPQKPTLPPKKPLPIKAKKPDIIGRKPEKKADTEKSAPLKKTAEDAVDGSHVKEMPHVQERSKPVDKKSTPEIKTSDTGEGMFTASLLLQKCVTYNFSVFAYSKQMPEADCINLLAHLQSEQWP